MRRVMVRYKVKSERVAEHEALLSEVFKELAAAPRDGLRYGAFKAQDGLSFVHVALISAEKNPLLDVAAFGRFTKDVGARCDEAPVTTEYTEAGSFAL